MSDFLVARILLTKEDILADGTGKEEIVLEHAGDITAQRLNGVVAHIDAIDLDRARLDLIETVDQRAYRGLTTTGIAH